MLTVFLCVQPAFSQTLIPYRKGELWGYCTPDKKIVIAPKYESAQWFSDGLAAVAYGCDRDCYDLYDGQWAYIDEKGNEVLPFRYDIAYPFNKGAAWVQIDGFWQKINKKGEVLYKHPEETCKGCVPQELSKKMDDTPLRISKELKAQYTSDDCKNDICFLGYYDHAKGIEYWEDPEAVFFLPIINLAEVKDSEVPLKVSNKYRFGYGALVSRQGVKLKPSLVYLTHENSEIKPENIFPLSEADFDEEIYVRFNIPDYEKVKTYIERAKQNPNQAKLMVALSVKIPTDSLKENVFFNIISKGIDFQTLEYGYTLFGYHTSMYEMTKPSWQQDCLASMAMEIRKVGSAMNEQKDEQNRMIQGKDNPYSGKMLFDVMEQTTENDVMEFLKYVSARPFIYMGQEHKLAEVFATWVDGGAPRVVSK